MERTSVREPGVSEMRISARTQYALRAMVALAAGDGPLAAGKISADQDIPRRFCDNILLHLRRAGLIQSARGPEGGYWLARSPEQISVADVIRVTEGVEPPPHFPGVSGPLTEILEKVRDREQAQLREITLAAVVASSRPPAPWRPPAPRPSE
ncbi:Rrf2 family transcriptional regulator [Herbidospora sp. NBRC 101105]|uniref:RrF2 family transcriptional regulator n=1 Tax=Herbidospora sp. NBRC 101105 TaxID=3032195 RepID=UPI0024A3680B|nr:Rrf2 family transcriptional regulator [Herbidospora sp. NBRC 101105]GLX97688.1 Rrf2 family transcriptional regulator [Herbidospora sp. NBRC 101105]